MSADLIRVYLRSSAACLLVLSPGSVVSAAENYPARPIRFILPYPPGGGNDFIARVLATKLAESISQQVVIDNRGGAHGIIATELTAKAPPDGYTIFMAGTGHAINPYMYKKLPYDSVKDFAPVSLAAVAPNILVLHPSVPAASIRELIALAKAKPATLSFGSAGGGGNTHLAGELLKLLADINIVHVPYRGTGPAVNDLLGGQINMLFAPAQVVTQHIAAGKLRMIGTTGAERSSLFPDFPTIAETGLPGYSSLGWFGMFAPAATPRLIVEKVSADVGKVLALPEARQRLVEVGAEPAPNTPNVFAAFVKQDIVKWLDLARRAGINLSP
jgi:tripartite-type tricarboxylate transporter receptor subunit TctC